MKSNLLHIKEVPPNCTCELLGTYEDDSALVAIDIDCPVHGMNASTDDKAQP